VIRRDGLAETLADFRLTPRERREPSAGRREVARARSRAIVAERSFRAAPDDLSHDFPPPPPPRPGQGRIARKPIGNSYVCADVYER